MKVKKWKKNFPSALNKKQRYERYKQCFVILTEHGEMFNWPLSPLNTFYTPSWQLVRCFLGDWVDCDPGLAKDPRARLDNT